MKKIKRSFSFEYALRRKVVRDLKIQTETVGTLFVEGMGYFDPTTSPIDVFDRYSVDLDFIRWNGTDIKDVLEITGGLEEIEEASVRYFANMIDDKIAA